MRASVKDQLWWWLTHLPDDTLYLFPSSGTGLLDPLAAATDELVAYLQETLDASLDASYGSAGLVQVVRGWPDQNGTEKPSTPQVLVSVTPGPMRITRVPASGAASYTSGGHVVSAVVYAYWQATFTVTVFCDDRSTRDKVSPWVHVALDPVDLLTPRGLLLESSGYHGRPVLYEITGQSSTDETETAMLGEWRSTWTLTSRSDLVRVAEFPAITEDNVTVTPTT